MFQISKKVTTTNYGENKKHKNERIISRSSSYNNISEDNNDDNENDYEITNYMNKKKDYNNDCKNFFSSPLPSPIPSHISWSSSNGSDNSYKRKRNDNHFLITEEEKNKEIKYFRKKEEYGKIPNARTTMMTTKLPIIIPDAKENGLVLKSIEINHIKKTRGFKELIKEIEISQIFQKYDVMGVMCKYHYNTDNCKHGDDCLYIHLDKQALIDVHVNTTLFPKKMNHITKTDFGNIFFHKNFFV